VQLVAVEDDRLAVQRVGQHRAVQGLAREPLLGQLTRRLVGGASRLDDRRQRHRARVGEALQQRLEAEVVVEVGMGDVDRRQLLAGGFDAVAEPLDVIGQEQRVDEHRLRGAAEDRCGGRRELPADRHVDHRADHDLQVDRSRSW
jgi:hypothetical protein